MGYKILRIKQIYTHARVYSTKGLWLLAIGVCSIAFMIFGPISFPDYIYIRPLFC